MAFHFLDALGQPHAALGIGAELLELALAAAAGVDLRLDHIERSGQRLGGGHRFLDSQGGDALGNGDAELGEEFLGLVFMDVHGSGSPAGKRAGALLCGAA